MTIQSANFHLCVHAHNNQAYALQLQTNTTLLTGRSKSNIVLWVLNICLVNFFLRSADGPICIDTMLWSIRLVSFLLCCAGAPICINTVLWNTIKLLFPKHAANAPESPADAILTPSSANNTALVANAVATLPMRRIGLIHGPYNPPRSAS